MMKVTTQISEKPWIEKYRPQVLKDIVGNKAIVHQLQQIAKIGNIPNMILTGPPGTGKTTAVLALANELLGDNFKNAVIELNASDERGISTVRDRIKSFASQKIYLPEGRHKIILLDEADSMTESAQQALRVIISDSSNTTRFIFSCNDSTKLISAIQSRCNMLRFSRLESTEIKKNIERIIELENIEYDSDGLQALIDTVDGDMRYAVNNLQSTVMGFGKLTKENLYKIIDIPKPDSLMDILNQCCLGNLDYVLSTVQGLLDQGYSIIDIIAVFFKIVQSSTSLNDKSKMEIFKEISTFKAQLLEGYDSRVQIYGFFATMVELANN